MRAVIDTSYVNRFVTVGSVRYGLRVGAVSPPPPGAGPRYRSQCCWPSSLNAGPGPRVPLLSASSINSPDIFKCVNRLRMAEDATSELGEHSSGRDQVLHSTKTLLKSQLRRRALFRSQDYSRLWEGDGVDIADTLDRLPRFRFGGNRGISKVRERDKRNNEQRLREQKKQPVLPPRVKHVSPLRPETGNDVSQHSQRVLPLRSASFSQVDYSPDDNKYIRRRQPVASDADASFARGALTLPRLKTISMRGESTSTSKLQQSEAVAAVAEEPPSSSCSNTDVSSVNSLYDIIYRECKDDKGPSLVQMTNELTELQTVDEESKVRSSETVTDGVSSLKANQEKKRDKSRRRKGIYISQWPNVYQSKENINISQFPVSPEANQSEQNPEIPKLKISEAKPDNFEMWSSPQEEPLSPEENTAAPEWTISRTNSTEEKEPTLLSSKISLSLLRSDSLSESEHEQNERKQEQNLAQSDISDCESRLSIGNEPSATHVPRRYSKRPLRGPYGQMLEAEMKKPEIDRKYQYSNDLKFLEDLSTSSALSTVSLSSSSSVGAGDPKPNYVVRSRGASNYSLDDSQLKQNSSLSLSPTKSNQPIVKRKVSVDNVGMAGDITEQEQKYMISHQRTTSSPSKLEGFSSAEVSSELLEQLLRGSSEQLAAEANQQRTNVSAFFLVYLANLPE